MVELIANYYVKVDEFNYTLCIKADRLDKEGNVVYKNISYHDNLENAIKACTKHILRTKLSESTVNLDKAIQMILNSNKQFEKLLKKSIESEE